MLTTEDLAYTGGIIDGEGCIGVYQTKPESLGRKIYQLTVRVSMVDSVVVRFLFDKFGGTFTYQKKSGEEKYPTWVVRNRVAETFLRQVIPYLKLKKEQAELALNLMDLRREQKVEANYQAYTPEMWAKQDSIVSHIKELKRVHK